MQVPRNSWKYRYRHTLARTHTYQHCKNVGYRIANLSPLITEIFQILIITNKKLSSPPPQRLERVLSHLYNGDEKRKANETNGACRVTLFIQAHYTLRSRAWAAQSLISAKDISQQQQQQLSPRRTRIFISPRNRLRWQNPFISVARVHQTRPYTPTQQHAAASNLVSVCLDRTTELQRRWTRARIITGIGNFLCYARDVSVCVYTRGGGRYVSAERDLCVKASDWGKNCCTAMVRIYRCVFGILVLR